MHQHLHLHWQVVPRGVEPGAGACVVGAPGLAHQVHGAIGFTKDYDLHTLTGPLQNWRSEYGNDAYWADVLGGIAAGLGGAGLWTEVIRRG